MTKFIFSLDYSTLVSMVEYIYTGKLILHTAQFRDISHLEKEDIILALLQAETFLQVRYLIFYFNECSDVSATIIVLPLPYFMSLVV